MAMAHLYFFFLDELYGFSYFDTFVLSLFCQTLGQPSVFWRAGGGAGGLLFNRKIYIPSPYNSNLSPGAMAEKNSAHNAFW